MHTMVSKVFFIDETDADLWLSDLLISMGIFPYLSGHFQIKSAVFVAARGCENIDIKEIYSVVAKNYGCSSSNIERNIRNALNISFKESMLMQVNRVLQVEVVKSNNHLLSNFQFISLISYYVKKKFRTPQTLGFTQGSFENRKAEISTHCNNAIKHSAT